MHANYNMHADEVLHHRNNASFKLHVRATMQRWAKEYEPK
jgi:hypothetical protein